VFDQGGRVIRATIIGATGDMKNLSDEDLRLILEKIRKWKAPGVSGIRLVMIRFHKNT